MIRKAPVRRTIRTRRFGRKFQGLLERLTRQLGADKVPDPRNEAIKILRERGHMHKDSERLTRVGQRREAMGPAGRAIDRAAKQSGRPKGDYEYVGGRARLRAGLR